MDSDLNKSSVSAKSFPGKKVLHAKPYRILLVSFVLLFCTLFIQVGPRFAANLLQKQISFEKEGDFSILADLSGLEPGEYYLSLGRVVAETEVLLDGNEIASDRVSLGTRIIIAKQDQSHHLKIKWLAKEKWRNRLYEPPMIFNYGTGLIFQTWRSFYAIYLGPIACLALILFLFFTIRLPSLSIPKPLPHFLMAVVTFCYMLILGGISDLFLNQEVTTLLWVLFRVAISGAFIYLMGSYSRTQRVSLGLHAIALSSLFLVYVARPNLLLDYYRPVGLALGPLAMLAAIALAKDTSGRRMELLSGLGFAWAIFNLVFTPIYLIYGPSIYTDLTPAFFTVFALTDFYIIYCEVVDLGVEAASANYIFRMASQVAHDIRSPLAALRMLASHSSSLSEEDRVLAQESFSRIDGIARDILEERKGHLLGGNPITAPVLTSIQEVIREKTIAFPERPPISISVEKSFAEVVARFDPQQLKRMLSNLINNAYDAADLDEKVEVKLGLTQDFVEISILDKGKGFPKELLAAIRRNDFKSTKREGAGLGISHAISCLNAWGGELAIESDEGAGSTVRIKLRIS